MTLEKLLDQGVVSFEAEGRLLQELGERLVGNPEIALVELIKNAYDADALSCSVEITENGDTIVVKDNGAGMTQVQFLERWMRIATAHKVNEPISPQFGRKRAGQKGIGRFAVRFLGRYLRLISVAHDAKFGGKTQLEAEFDWKTIDKSKDISTAKVPFRLKSVPKTTPDGVSLEISDLRHELDFLKSKEFRTEVLRVVSPLQSLERGRFVSSSKGEYETDSGFKTVLPSAEGTAEVDIAKAVLGRAWARLTIDVTRSRVKYVVESDANGPGEPPSLTAKIDSKLSVGAFADIRFFPRRAGVFQGEEVDGRKAWTWVRENCGVAVVDHGFRTRPYGFKDDDWLHLDIDGAHNERDWRSPISKMHFPIPPEVGARPSENPALNLPANHQLVGAVFVESRASGGKKEDDEDLVVAMDREGFVNNAAYVQLVEIVRAGVEFLAITDKANLQRLAEIRAKEAAKNVRRDFAAAVEQIEDSKTLSPGDKSRLVYHYSSLAKKVEEVEEYGREARRKLETMGLLGVVAGFMTHEAARILDGLERALAALKRLGTEDPKLIDAIDAVENGYEAFKGHVEYTSLFVESLHREPLKEFKAGPQVRRILDKFGSFAKERGITAANEIGPHVEVKSIPVAAYSGVLLNLYTNALKAVLAREGRPSGPHIVFRAWTEKGGHSVEVLDKGVGIPPGLAGRIFDPLFTTTSNTGNPLGSGMGLGLSMVREVLSQFGGKVRLVDPPAGFATCFRVDLSGEH